MSYSTQKPPFQNVLKQVRRGSIEHISRLLDDWPESLKDNSAAADAMLNHLSADRIPEGHLQASDYDLARVCIIGVTRAMQAAINGPLSSEPHIRKIIDTIVNGLNGILMWMSTCVLTCGRFTEENEDYLPSCRMLIGHIGAAIAQFCTGHPNLGKAMKASSIAPSVVANLWSWIDPQTRLPLFMFDLNDGIENGCFIIDALVCYIYDSKDVAMAVLRAFSEEKAENLDKVTANDVVDLGLMRFQLMRDACKKPGAKIPLIGRSLTWLTEAYTDFIKTEDPNFLSAIHNRAFLRELTSTIKYVSGYLWNPRDPPTEMTLIGIPLLAKALPWWTRKAFSSSSAMCQVLQGGLLSILIETLAFVQMTGSGSAERRVTYMYKKDCEGIGAILGGFVMYPSVVNVLSNVFDKKLNTELCQGVLKKRGHWTAELWLSVLNAFEGRKAILRTLQLEGPTVAICDNGEHDPGIDVQGDTRVCSHCHAAMYCSEACQRQDWEECHREDCKGLSEVYQVRKSEHTWVHTSTRLYLLAIAQDAFRSTVVGADKKRKEKYPNVAPQDLVYILNFCIPPYSTDERVRAPSVVDLPGYVKILKGYGSLYPIGIRRVNRLLHDFQAEEQVVIVVAMFPYREEALYVVSRVRIPMDDGGGFMPAHAVVIGGFSYMTSMNLSALGKHLQK